MVHNSLINGRNIIITIGILIQTTKIKIRLADRAYIGEANNRIKTKHTPRNFHLPGSVRSVACISLISTKSTGASTGLKKIKFIFEIQTVHFAKILHEKY